MKTFMVLMVLGSLVSCAPDPRWAGAGAKPVQRATYQAPLPVPERRMSGKPSRTVRIRPPGAVGQEEKWLSGAVTFRGLQAGQLAQFRVIPEGGSEIFQPQNGRYRQVDGFWWRGDLVNWYKIPDHAEAWVVGPHGVKPTGFDGVDARKGFSVYRKATPGLGVASVLGGGVKEAGFHPRQGRTMIGVPYPF